jgi:hypothetical protein
MTLTPISRSPAGAFRALAAVVAGCMLSIATARADESEFCRQLSAVVAAAPNKFRTLRTERFDNRLESFETNLQLAGMETCRIDAISPGYFCMVRGLSKDAGDELAGELVQRVHSCYPYVRAEQGMDRASPVPRQVTDWQLDGGPRIRIVRRTYRDHPGSVFIYVR